jgi:hypothetical protein
MRSVLMISSRLLLGSDEDVLDDNHNEKIAQDPPKEQAKNRLLANATQCSGALDSPTGIHKVLPSCSSMKRYSGKPTATADDKEKEDHNWGVYDKNALQIVASMAQTYSISSHHQSKGSSGYLVVFDHGANGRVQVLTCESLRRLAVTSSPTSQLSMLVPFSSKQK